MRLMAQALSLANVRDVAFCHPVQTHLSWGISQDFQKPCHTCFLQICANGQIISG